MITFERFCLEKFVIGLIEPIIIKDIGQVDAKIDSGNGAYNVIDGVDVQIQGSKVTFKTVNNRRLMKPIVEMVTINVGAGHTETRPVVLFDIQIGDRVFNDVKFSIGNRANNAHKVLISKTFVQDELDALIDVGSEGIADQMIEVDY